MNKTLPEYLTRALGNLPGDCKAGFISEALGTLHKYQKERPAQRPRLPRADRLALSRVSRQTARLIEAMNSAQETETATMLLRDVWLNLDHSSGEKLGNPMPTLARLQQAVDLCLPEKKSPRKPLDKSPESTLAVIALAEQFRQHFGKPPSFGTASPFVRFVREALPAYGLFVPSLVEIRRMAAAT